jgi:signal transduction histidine kinase/DNA-binding response OmpR family regulator
MQPARQIYQAFLVMIALSCCKTVVGQTRPSEIDSIERSIKSAATDTGRVIIMLAAVRSLPCEDSALYLRYLSKCLTISKNIQWESGLAQTYNFLGDIYSACPELRNYDTSVKYYGMAVRAAEAAGDNTLQIASLSEAGSVYESMTKYPKALNCYKQILDLSPSPPTRMGALGNIGSIYTAIGDYPLALSYYLASQKVLEEYIATGKAGEAERAQVGSLLLTIARIYVSMKQYNDALKNYDRILTLSIKDEGTKAQLQIWAQMGIAETYRSRNNDTAAVANYRQALYTCRRYNQPAEEANILNNLGDIYLRIGQTDTAARFADTALRIIEKFGLTYQQPAIYVTLGEILTAQKKHSEAISYLQKAVGISKEAGSLENEKNAWHALSKTYQEIGSAGLALTAYQNFIGIRDSLYSIDKAKELNRIDLQSEYERQKAAADAAHNLQIQQQRLWTYGGFAGLGLVILLSFFIYRNYANQKKANVLITLEKENAEMQRQRAERSEAFKQQFLANMSHEIRTPMNAVSGMTDLLIEKNPRADQLNYLQVISKSADILLHIINDILDLSKIEAGKLEMEQIDFSLADTVQLVKETLSVRAEEKGLHLLTNIGSEVQDVLVGDPYRINQILMNLGGNAIKFTEGGSVEINVQQLSEDDSETKLKFSVTDTGAGIPEDKLNSLFESFKQVNTSDSRKYGGTGLGLSISKQLVELQGGKISVESKEGVGTTFSFVLSFPIGSAEKLAARTRKEQKADGRILNGLRILLADDNEYNRLVANEALSLKANVTIDEAHDGQEAIDMLQLHDYDVILMDVLMPVLNGLDATRYIRAHLPEPKNATPVIALTASMLRNDLDKCVQAGMNSYVTKPFKTWQLIAAIAQVTGRTNFTPPPEENEPGSIAEAVPPANENGVTDIAGLIKYCEGEMDRVKRYVGIYLKSIPAFEQNATAAIAEKNIDEIAVLVHTFKPKWAMMGMTQSTDLCHQIETLCEENGAVDEICGHMHVLIEFNRLSATELENFA